MGKPWDFTYCHSDRLSSLLLRNGLSRFSKTSQTWAHVILTLWLQALTQVHGSPALGLQRQHHGFLNLKSCNHPSWFQAKCELELLGTRMRPKHVMWARLKVKSCFPSMKYLLLPWKPLQGVCSPSPNQCPPTRPHSLSPGPHGDLNAPGWSWESIFHTLTKMCRLRVEGLFSITIWNILALFPELIIALGKAFPPKYSPRNQLEMNWEVWNTDFLGKESPCQGEGWSQAYVSWLCQGYKWTLKVTKSIHTFASLLSPTSIDIWF